MTPLKNKALSWAQITQQMQSMTNNDPEGAAEWWIYELVKYARQDPDAISMTFSKSILHEGFSISKDVFPACPEFFDDIRTLIEVLPVLEDHLVERKLLIDLTLEAARECNMRWWDNMRERAAVLFGVIHACMI